MLNRLQNKSLIVLGGGSGIGAGTVRRLTSEGARVCVADINLEAAERVAAHAATLGGEAFATKVDIADEAAVNAGVDLAAERFGGLDGAYVNAADLSIIYRDTDALSIDLEVFDRTIAVNLRGHLLCTRAVVPHLLKRGGGALVYTSSGASVSGGPERPSYASSKGGLEALMRHVASRWGREGITSNCVAPGVVITPEAEGKVPEDFLAHHRERAASPRLGKVEDLAAVVALLLSEDGRWINGQVFHINGGAQMR